MHPTFLRPLLLLGALSLGACGRQDAMVSQGDRSIEGEDRSIELVGGAIDRGHRYTVAVGDHLCTGSLISSRTVLSAAHCAADPKRLDAVRFGAGEGEFSSTIPIVQAVVHPGYDKGTYRNDLLLLQLAYDAPVPPVPLLRETLQDTAAFVGPRLTFVGYGRTVWIADNSGTKRVATFPIDGLGPATVGGKVGSIDETMFYYSRRDAHTCNGDSGGPSYLVRNGLEHQAGVTSHGEPYCRDVGVQARADGPQVASFIQPTIDAFEPGNHCRADLRCDETCFGDGQSWDPDCYANHCQADGVCVTACAQPVDPDCAFLDINHCQRDGLCDPRCAEPDFDCAS